jgi:hypothetical protein
MIKLIMELIHFLFEIILFFSWNIGNGVSNIYNNHDKTYHGIFLIFIWNTSIYAWKIGKGFSNILNNHDKACHGIVLFFI